MADWPAAEAVDQPGRPSPEQILLPDQGFRHQPPLQAPPPHHPRQAAAAQRWGDPAAPPPHQQVGGGAAAEAAGGAGQQGIVGAGGAGLAAGLDRGPIGEALAAAQQAGGAAGFGGADDHPQRREAGLDCAELQPEAGLVVAGKVDPSAGAAPVAAAPAPVEPQGTAAAQGRADAAAGGGCAQQALHGRCPRWWWQPQQGRRALPALQMLRQQPGAAGLHQHRFKQAVGQQQAPIVERYGQVSGAAPATMPRAIPQPGNRGGHGLGAIHARASSSGCSFQPSSSASAAGSESATMPQPAWARSRWPRSSSERIRMLLSNCPSVPSRNREPQ